MMSRALTALIDQCRTLRTEGARIDFKRISLAPRNLGEDLPTSMGGVCSANHPTADLGCGGGTAECAPLGRTRHLVASSGEPRVGDRSQYRARIKCGQAVPAIEQSEAADDSVEAESATQKVSANQADGPLLGGPAWESPSKDFSNGLGGGAVGLTGLVRMGSHHTSSDDAIVAGFGTPGMRV